MFYSVNKDELKHLIEHRMSNSAIPDNSFRPRVEEAYYWQEELGISTYLLCQILDRKVQDGISSGECFSIIRAVYEMKNIMWVNIQELDATFISFMIRQLRPPQDSNNRDALEEDMVELFSNLGQYKYETAIRY